MAFIRTKTVNGKEYAQVVESYREEGKVRQRMLLHLGKYSPVEALISWQAFADDPVMGEATCRHYAAKAARLKELIHEGKVKVTAEDMRHVEKELAAREEEREARLKWYEEMTAHPAVSEARRRHFMRLVEEERAARLKRREEITARFAR